jgi:hypothetical protein
VRSFAILALFATTAVADEIPNKPLRGELAGKSFVPDDVFIWLDGNNNWVFRADLENGKVTFKLPFVFPPATGECIERPQTQIDATISDMRSGTIVWSAGVRFTLRFDEVTADHAKGGIYVAFSPLPLGGEKGWFGGRFDVRIKHEEDFGKERACTKAELTQPPKAPFAGMIGKTKVAPKKWQLVEIPDGGRRTHHWRLAFGDIGIDLDGTPAVQCTTRSITGRRMEAYVGLDPLTYVVKFDTITADKATGWLSAAWEDGTSTAAGRFEAAIVHEQAEPDAARLCK